MTCLKVRKARESDAARWRELWDGYTRFYLREPQDNIAQNTWARILSPNSSINAIVVESPREFVVGIANYVIHENASTILPVCYLQDLYVEPTFRSQGVGRTILDWFVNEMKVQGWARVYWNTRENNYRARGLYDKYTPHSGFLKYSVPNSLTNGI